MEGTEGRTEETTLVALIITGRETAWETSKKSIWERTGETTGETARKTTS